MSLLNRSCGVFLIALVAMCMMADSCVAQKGQGADGNPHGWDRRRRCDQTDYSPPCGVCEGYGGIPFGDENDEITLTTCEPIGNASTVKPGPRPQWGATFTVPLYNEVLIGPKSDPFCFNSFPSNSSVGPLCYRPDSGRQSYDAVNARALRLDLDSKTKVGNVSSTIIHQGENMWIVNKLPWYAAGVHQCICTKVQQASDAEAKLMYPVQYNWTNHLVFIGRERIGVEYMGGPASEHTEILDHWSFGPHHAWTVPESGEIRRLWQPFNGLEVFPRGMSNKTVDPSLFNEIPPALCKKKGGAIFRIKCTDDGFPEEKKDKVTDAPSRSSITGHSVTEADEHRAVTKVPRAQYKGVDFEDMSYTLNNWLSTGALTKGRVSECEGWKLEDIQQLQAFLFLLRDEKFDNIYQSSLDNRRLRGDLESLQKEWEALSKDITEAEVASDGHRQQLKDITRDGHCHEAVMWYVHHLTSDVKKVLSELPGFTLPLLSRKAHNQLCSAAADVSKECNSPSGECAFAKVCKAYQEKVTCSSCHSNARPPPGHDFLRN